MGELIPSRISRQNMGVDLRIVNLYVNRVGNQRKGERGAALSTPALSPRHGNDTGPANYGDAKRYA